MDQAKVIATPVETNNKLVKASDDEEMYDQQKYRQLWEVCYIFL